MTNLLILFQRKNLFPDNAIWCVKENGYLGLDDDMYTTTRKSSAIFAIMVIASTALILLTSTTTAFTFAAKAGLSDHSSKDSDGYSIAIAVQILILIAGPVITYHLQTTEMKT